MSDGLVAKVGIQFYSHLVYTHFLGTVQRPSYSPDAMTFPEMYEKVHGKALEGDERAAYEVIAANWGPASKGLVLPINTPAEIVDVWRGAILS